jgi:putative NADPH-quinone reductase
VHELAFEDFVAPIRQTARFCGMAWELPITLHGAHLISDDEIASAALALRDRLSKWLPDPQAIKEIRRPNDFE